MYDSNPRATFSHAVEQLNQFDLGYLHITEVGKEAAGAAGPVFGLDLLRQIWQGIYITNGGYDQSRGNAAIISNAADAIAFGTLFLANPDLPSRFRLNAALNEADYTTFYEGGELGYADYPELGKP